MKLVCAVMNNIGWDNILSGIGTLISYLIAQKFFFPLVVEFWQQIKGIKEAKVDIKKTELTYNEQQFEILLNQITSLEEELKAYSKELQKLRMTVLELNSKLYNKQVIIMDLQKKCCERENCPNRIACQNYLCNIVEDYEDNK
jgi:septal ring factor EnvC (AmiA/AmiB activator)